jgi:hypothetical protein
MKNLLEIKYDGKQNYINNPNNPNEPRIFKHKNFRLICTTFISDLDKLSLAFSSRMDIKMLNDQLEGINEEDLSTLIKICMNNVKAELISYEEVLEKRLKELKELLELSKIK